MLGRNFQPLAKANGGDALMNVRRFGFTAVLAALVAVIPSNADVITSLYSTGFTNTGALQSEGGADGNWTITTNPSGTGSTAYVTTTDGFPIGAWVPNGANGQWIQPTSGTTDTHVPGDYVYQTTFSLAGFDPTSAQLSFQAAADNRITGVLLNGFNTGFTWTGASGSGDAYASFSPLFSISNPAWFQNGDPRTFDHDVGRLDGRRRLGDPPPSDRKDGVTRSKRTIRRVVFIVMTSVSRGRVFGPSRHFLSRRAPSAAVCTTRDPMRTYTEV
jgi:hypothetical protein